MPTSGKCHRCGKTINLYPIGNNRYFLECIECEVSLCFKDRRALGDKLNFTLSLPDWTDEEIYGFSIAYPI